MLNKKGVSAVIGTVIMIGLVMLSALLVWGVVSQFAEESSEEISFGRISLNLDILNVKVNEGNLDVRVERTGKGDLEGITFIIESGEEQEIFEIESNLSEFEKKTFSFELTEFLPENTDKVSVAPILSSGTSTIRDVYEPDF